MGSDEPHTAGVENLPRKCLFLRPDRLQHEVIHKIEIGVRLCGCIDSGRIDMHLTIGVRKHL